MFLGAVCCLSIFILLYVTIQEAQWPITETETDDCKTIMSQYEVKIKNTK